MKRPLTTAIIALLLTTHLALAADTKPTIGLYVAPSTEWSPQTIDALSSALTESGNVVRLAPKPADTPLNADDYWLIVVADAKRVAAELPEALAAYARNGGNLALLGGPFFDAPLSSYGDKLLDHQALVKAVAHDVRPKVVLDFEQPDLPRWQNHSNQRSEESSVTRVEGGAAGTQGALKLRASGEAGWDTFQSPTLEATVDPQHLLTTFWAKGDGPKSQLVVEWRERDGSRWMTTVRLSDQWQRYVLPVEAFRYWHDSSVRGRGGKGDTLHPENVATITLGLAHTHALFTGIEGHRTIWVDEIGFAPAPDALRRPADLMPNRLTMPVIETASPRYKLFEVTNAKRLQVNPAQWLAPHVDLPAASTVYAPIPKPDGTGLDRARPARVVPLIQSLDETGRAQASPATLMIPADATHGMVLSVPIADAGFFAHKTTIDWIGSLVERMQYGMFLLEGGAKYYASFGEEEMPFGAVVVNRGFRAQTVAVELTMGDAAGHVLQKKSFSVDVQPGEQQRVAAPLKIPQEKGYRFQVSVRLLSVLRFIDQVEHTFRIWQPKPSPQFLTARDGDFYLGDTPWFAHGVNYMPSSGAACEDHAAFEFWMDGRAYGQEIVRRDLQNLKAIGLNSVSVFVYHRSHAERNLLDFLMQCEEHGLKVNLSLRPGTPLDFRWEEMREMIVDNRLAENDTVIAYDLAWEPMWGLRPQRKRHDPQWRQWIDKTYGSIGGAEAAWLFAAPRENNQIVGPTDAHIVEDGPWRKMVLDYRRFLNETLDQAYGRARELVRSVDNNHLVSFRMTIAGDPTTQPARMAYDPAGLANAVDIMEPEGYGRIGDWDKVRPGWFTVAYCRAVAPDLPVLWAEFGYSVWDPTTGGASPDRLGFAGQFYDDFLRMAYESDSGGTFCWYSCGGYRVNERSDYGILGPDGAWRPHTHALHRWADKMKKPRARKPVDKWIPIQLDRDVDGVTGIYRRTADQFWQTIENNQTPGLRIQ